MSEVFMCERGQLNNRSKADLRRAGIVVVEVNDLGKCQFVRATETVSGSDMLWAAMNALKKVDESYGGSKGNSQRAQLAWNLIALVEAQHKQEQETVS